ncbi:MAG: hypothetical protein LBF04_07820 [Prevotellaceae bacterium]|jgi:hypothetical protein|nr:hypothetical protein [Prevotellaceae bacterium]
MQIITHNPYRILGIPVGATAREKERQARKLKQYLEAEQEPPQDDYSFPILGAINRTVESIAEAASKLNLDSDKMNAALFWFWKGNDITDEPAFEALKEDDINTSANIWTKLTETGEVTKQNASAFQNLSTLCLSDVSDTSKLKQGICLKLKFLESDFAMDFKETAADITLKTTKKELQFAFLTAIYAELEKTNKDAFALLLKIIDPIEFRAKQDFVKEIIQKPINAIQSRINATTEKLKNDEKDPIKLGNTLYKETAADIAQLRYARKANRMAFTSISDRLANIILDCAIFYVNYWQSRDDAPENYNNNALNLAKKAQSLAAGTVTKQRYKENIEIISQNHIYGMYIIVNVLKTIKDAYMNLAWNQHLDMSDVKRMIRQDITDERIVKLAVSGNDDAIDEFYGLLQYLIFNCNFSSNTTSLLSKIKQTFYHALPQNSKLKKEINKELEQKKLRKKEKQEQRIIKTCIWSICIASIVTSFWVFARGIDNLIAFIAIFGVAITLSSASNHKLLKKIKPKTWIVTTCIIVGALASVCVICHMIKQNKEWQLYISAIETNSEIACNEYLKTYTNKGKYQDKILEKLEDITWEEALKSGKYDDYLEKYPYGKYITELDDIIWEKTKETNKKEKYDDYLKKFPNGKHRYLAELFFWNTDSKAWNEARKQNTSVAYKKYLKLYPNGNHVKQAEKLLIDMEVDEIVKGKTYWAPSPMKTDYEYSNYSTVYTYNATPYMLTLLYSGTESKKFKIPSNQKKSISLKNGKYRIVVSIYDNDNDYYYITTKTLLGGEYEHNLQLQ